MVQWSALSTHSMKVPGSGPGLCEVWVSSLAVCAPPPGVEEDSIVGVISFLVPVVIKWNTKWLTDVF